MGLQPDWNFARRGKGSRGTDEDFLKDISQAIATVTAAVQAGGITMIEAQRRIDALREMWDTQAFEVELQKLEEDFK